MAEFNALVASLSQGATGAGEFDVAVLDQIVAAAYNPMDPNRIAAHQAMMQLQEVPDLWQKADGIIEKANNPHTRFYGLSILDSAIKTRWKILPPPQKEGIRNYIVGKIIAMSQEEETLARERVLVGKLNLTLVEILKQEWPHNWPSFISDLVGSSKTSEVLCENNMQILKLLSEEVFDFSKDQMVTEKVKRMKESLNSEFSQVFQLCEFVMANSQRPSLLRITLQTLQRFLTWIPLGYIFQTNLIDVLVNKFFAAPVFRNEALDCLTEIGTLQGLDPQYDVLFRQLFTSFLTRLADVFGPDTDLRQPFEGA